MDDQRQRLLIVEDDAWIAILLASFAGDAGYQVVGPVARLSDACSIAASQPLDAAVLDVHLLDGALSYPVADILARRRIPYAFITSEAPDRIADAYSSKPLLSKPFSDVDFRALLGSRLNQIQKSSKVARATADKKFRASLS